MKTKLLLISTALGLLFSSCSSILNFEKRKYRPGYYFSGRPNSTAHQEQKDVSADIMLTDEHIISENGPKDDGTVPVPRVLSHSKDAHAGFEPRIDRSSMPVNGISETGKPIVTLLNSIHKCPVSRFKKGSTDHEMDNVTKGAIQCTLLGIGFGLLAFLLLFMDNPAFMLIAVLALASSLLQLIGFVDACRAMHQHRKDKEKYPGKGAVRVIFWAYLLGVAAALIGTLITLATFSMSVSLM